MSAPVTKPRKTPPTIGRPHLKLTWGGTIGAKAEIWSNSLNIIAVGTGGDDVGVDESKMDDLCSQAATAINRFYTDRRSHTSQSFNLEWVKLNHVNELGLYTNQDTTHRFDFAGPVAGTAPAYPWQVACVLTLRTSAKRGKGHAGRFYHPVGQWIGTGFDQTAHAIDPTTGLWSAEGAADLAAVGAELIRDLSFMDDHTGNTNNPGEDFFQVVTIPRVLVGQSYAGLSKAITSVEVDRVLDTMRSRTNAIPRNSTTVPVPIGQ